MIFDGMANIVSLNSAVGCSDNRDNSSIDFVRHNIALEKHKMSTYFSSSILISVVFNCCDLPET
jgi:hypothetical protein